MSTRDSLAAGVEEKKKRLEELKRKKQMAEANSAKKQAEEIKTPRSSRLPDASINDIMAKMLSPVENKPPPVVEEPVKTVVRPVLELSGSFGAIVLKGREKAKTKEDEAQVDLPKVMKDVKKDKEIVGDLEKVQKSTQNEVKERKGIVDDSENDELAERILRSNEINEFLTKSSRIVERVLGQDDPSLYVTAENELKPVTKLFSNEYADDHCISGLQWSPRFNELLMTSYLSVSRSMSSELRGLICLWSLTLKGRPEYVLRCQSSVTSCTFNRFDHNLVIAGSYSGQIVVWDLRTKSHPILKTPLMAESHTHPVYCVSIIGSQHANNIVSASNDGKVCVWSLNMFTSPTSSFDLKNRVKDIGCTSIAFPDNETNTFYVGAEDGSLLQTQLHGSKSSDASGDVFEAHFGPITGLDIHPVGENIFTDLAGNLLLSSSVDWSVKLWNPKMKKTAILSFDIYDDYVFDVKWSPVHPSVFAVAEGTGLVDIWNLNQDIEMPACRLKTPGEAINKLAWQNTGEMLATGNCNGEVKVFKVPKEFVQPTPEDWSNLENLIILN
jgi:dynein intermediate chain